MSQESGFMRTFCLFRAPQEQRRTAGTCKEETARRLQLFGDTSRFPESQQRCLASPSPLGSTSSRYEGNLGTANVFFLYIYNYSLGISGSLAITFSHHVCYLVFCPFFGFIRCPFPPPLFESFKSALLTGYDPAVTAPLSPELPQPGEDGGFHRRRDYRFSTSPKLQP